VSANTAIPIDFLLMIYLGSLLMFNFPPRGNVADREM